MKTRVVTTGLAAFLFPLVFMAHPSLGQPGSPYPPPGPPPYNAPYNPNYQRFFPPPGTITPQQLPELANTLATEAQQLLDNLRFELYGTFEGRQLEMRAGAVLSAATQVARNAQLGGPGGAGQVPAAMNQFDAAFAELNDRMRGIGANPPRSSASIDRLQRAAFQIRNLLGAYGPPPGGPPPFGGGPPIVIPGLPCSVRNLADATANLRIATSNYMGFVPNPFRDLAASSRSLNDQVRFFQGLQSAPVTYDELRQSFQQIRVTASDINTLLAQSSLPPPVIQGWAPVLESINRLSSLLAIPGQLVLPNPGIGGGVVVNPGLPFPRPRPPGPGGPPPAFLALLDQAVAESDGFLEGISANAVAVPGGFQFVADARNLRGNLLSMTQQLRQGASRRELAQTMATARSFANAIETRIAIVARGQIGPNIARFKNLANMLDQLQAMLD